MPRTEDANQVIREERRHQILKSAAQVFARQGYVGTRIEDIAAAADSSKGLLYHYFAGKEEVFNTLIAMIEAGVRHLFEEAQRLDASPGERLRWLIEREVLGFEQQAQMFPVVLQALVSDSVPDEARDLALGMGRRSQVVMREWIAAGQQSGEIIEGDPDQLALLLITCINGLAVTAAMSLPSGPSAVESLMRLLLRPSQ